MSDNNFKKGPHAAKNKISEDVIDGKISDVDERKTVVLDEDLENVDFDDKMWLYWKRNRNFIIFTVTAAFAIVIGTQGWKMYKSHSAAQLATAYETASATNDLHNFARTNNSSKLGGVALLESADKMYVEKKYAEAKKIYAESADILSSTPLFGRALLGEAMCGYFISAKDGKELFAKIFNNKEVEASYRAQAGINLAQANIAEGKEAEAKKILTQIANDAKNGYYARMAADELSRLN